MVHPGRRQRGTHPSQWGMVAAADGPNPACRHGSSVEQLPNRRVACPFFLPTDRDRPWTLRPAPCRRGRQSDQCPHAWNSSSVCWFFNGGLCRYRHAGGAFPPTTQQIYRLPFSRTDNGRSRPSRCTGQFRRTHGSWRPFLRTALRTAVRIPLKPRNAPQPAPFLLLSMPLFSVIFLATYRQLGTGPAPLNILLPAGAEITTHLAIIEKSVVLICHPTKKNLLCYKFAGFTSI